MGKSNATSIKLAQWTEKVSCTTSRDPLGLANRVSQRLVHQLLFGITANTDGWRFETTTGTFQADDSAAHAAF